MYGNELGLQFTAKDMKVDTTQPGYTRLVFTMPDGKPCTVIIDGSITHFNWPVSVAKDARVRVRGW